MLRNLSVSPRTRRTSLNVLAALGLALTGAACADSSTGNAVDGKITVLLKDAPGDVKAAVVTISQVYLQGSADGDDAGSRVIGPTQRNVAQPQNTVRLAQHCADPTVKR